MKRRSFIKKAATGTTGIILLPTIVPPTVFGKSAPSNRIHIGQIGCGRITRGHDMFETFKYEDAILAGFHQIKEAACCTSRDRASLMFSVPGQPYCNETEPKTLLGSSK